MMLVILLGQIDLSVPWVGGGRRHDGLRRGRLRPGRRRRLRFRSASSAASLIGLVNGIGVAYLRIPSMIITLATNAVAQGLMVVYTGGFSPQDSASAGDALSRHRLHHSRACRTRSSIWALIGAATVFLLTRTTFGRAVYGIGNRERAAYLSGVNTRRVVMIAFAISGGLAAFGGVLLAGYASKAAQSMGDAYLLPAIAAVVLGGTSILGGRGTYLGTVAGVILITLLQSILSVMQMPEAGRQIIYGVVIVAMLLLYGRSAGEPVTVDDGSTIANAPCRIGACRRRGDGRCRLRQDRGRRALAEAPGWPLRRGRQVASGRKCRAHGERRAAHRRDRAGLARRDRPARSRTVGRRRSRGRRLLGAEAQLPRSSARLLPEHRFRLSGNRPGNRDGASATARVISCRPAWSTASSPISNRRRPTSGH